VPSVLFVNRDTSRKVIAVADENVGAEFPGELVAACVRRYRHPIREHANFVGYRREGRSFPTDYVAWGYWFARTSGADSLLDQWNSVVRELDDLRPRRLLPKLVRQAKQSETADRRVFAGPSDADVAELPHIEDAWCVAEFICAELGLRSETWEAVETAQALRRVHLRYGLMLDWATRDVAQRMARDRDGLDTEHAFNQYGLDPIRVSLEHGAAPDELDELSYRAGLRARGSLSPIGTPRSSGFRDEWFDSTSDPGFREIAAIKERIGREELGEGL
jgi:hypothetical protein